MLRLWYFGDNDRLNKKRPLFETNNKIGYKFSTLNNIMKN